MRILYCQLCNETYCRITEYIRQTYYAQYADCAVAYVYNNLHVKIDKIAEIAPSYFSSAFSVSRGIANPEGT